MKLLSGRKLNVRFHGTEGSGGQDHGRAGGKDYGAITVAVGYYSRPSVIMDVPPDCFIQAGSGVNGVRLDLAKRRRWN